MEPEELRAEQRWSSIPAQPTQSGYWPQHLDEELLVLVTRSTASRDRFPVGVNWLDISRSIGFSPVECVKRYAFLHDFRERHSSASQLSRKHQAHHVEEGEKHSEEVQAPFSGLSSSDDMGSPNSRAFLEYGSPVTSPRLESLENSGEFGVGSPSSPPPFALHLNRKQEASPSSPFRWETVAKEMSDSPVLLRAQARRRTAERLETSFGVRTEFEPGSDTQGTGNTGVQSPRIIHGTQNHSKFTDPTFAADIVSHAFKGLRMDDMPPSGTSPRLARVISNSEYPFLRAEDLSNTNAQATGQAPRSHVPRTASDPFLRASSPRVLGQASPLTSLSPTHSNDPFTESLTQSALEEAFLDMAGSRLDTSSMLFASRFGTQSRARLEQLQARPQQDRGQSRADHAWPSPRK
ncbi:hypothetical protein Poli38472_005250 [Pythium oligandrum]|uniref:Uncharacterized protein n=1 Tax=Pythium oligandrum TaxID=41045 RepID=A0A8K1CFZ7_PYTOL|nr:hypothetical protein Poli38472_005250 [Pythium oligandrum]|eukprot:TMW62632.1 hypothetical protein Poli38472_005250 [Pythium oligandrum]